MFLLANKRVSISDRFYSIARHQETKKEKFYLSKLTIFQIPLSDAMKAKARLTIGGGRDFDNGRVSSLTNLHF